MKKTVTKIMPAAQQRKKQEYDRSVQRGPSITVENDGFVTRPPLGAPASENSENFVESTYDKLMQHAK